MVEAGNNFEEVQQAFEDYMEEVKKLPLEAKKQELIDSIKELIASIDLLAQEDGIDLHYLTSKEILDKPEQNKVDDDYIESMLVYVETAKNMLGEYLSTEK